MSLLQELERRTRSLPPVVRQLGWSGIAAARTPVELARWAALRRSYRRLAGAEPLRWADSQLELRDRLTTSPFDRHYFYQDAWAARRVADAAPDWHVDVGSRVDLVGFLTTICPITFVDIRPLEADLDRLTSIAGSVLDLPFPDRSVRSISCLHVIEHVGLGRYGDPLDPEGTAKAVRELARVVAPGGQLLLSTPVGASRTVWNSHRVSDPVALASALPEFELAEFAGVDDGGVFRRDRAPSELAGQTYACGMYRFVRPAD
jgi:hypothetical protein